MLVVVAGGCAAVLCMAAARFHRVARDFGRVLDAHEKRPARDFAPKGSVL